MTHARRYPGPEERSHEPDTAHDPAPSGRQGVRWWEWVVIALAAVVLLPLAWWATQLPLWGR